METAPLFCDVNGQRIAYHQEGRGETVLLLHGITTYSFIWRKITPLLSDRFRAISIDLLGCGDADLYLSEAIAMKLHNDIPGSILTGIPTGGHFIQEDEPELLAGAISRFAKVE